MLNGGIEHGQLQLRAAALFVGQRQPALECAHFPGQACDFVLIGWTYGFIVGNHARIDLAQLCLDRIHQLLGLEWFGEKIVGATDHTLAKPLTRAIHGQVDHRNAMGGHILAQGIQKCFTGGIRQVVIENDHVWRVGGDYRLTRRAIDYARHTVCLAPQMQRNVSADDLIVVDHENMRWPARHRSFLVTPTLAHPQSGGGHGARCWLRA